MVHDTAVRRERPLHSSNGYLMLLVGLALLGAGAAMVSLRIAAGPGIVLIVLGGLTLGGLYMLQPNEAAILLLFGQYRGTDRSEGLRWAIPFYSRKRISLRARN